MIKILIKGASGSRNKKCFPWMIPRGYFEWLFSFKIQDSYRIRLNWTSRNLYDLTCTNPSWPDLEEVRSIPRRKFFSSNSKGPSDDFIQEEFEKEFESYNSIVTSKTEAFLFKKKLLKNYGSRKGTAYFALIELRNMIFFGIDPYNLEDCEDDEDSQD